MPFKIVRNDIIKMQVDAIVNTANPLPIYASGTDTAIYEAAGKTSLLSARRKIGMIKPGEAAITSGFKLPAKYIIHTVGPIYGTKHAAEYLGLCYMNSLKLALEHKCESIAFPLIASGNYGYPKAEALQIAVSSISKFLTKEDMVVYLVVFDNESFEVSGKLFADIDSYIDARYIDDKLEKEYCKKKPASFDFETEPLGSTTIQYSVSIPCEEYSSDNARFSEKKRIKRESEVLSDVPDIPQFLRGSAKRMNSVPDTFYSVGSASNIIGDGSYKRAERSLDDVIAQMSETFQQRLLRLIDEKGMTDVDVYKRANLDRKLFSKIRCNVDYKPKKLTAVALAIALELSLDDTKDLLSRAELAFSPSSKFDLIIEYFLEREIYDVYTINMALFKHEQPILGE